MSQSEIERFARDAKADAALLVEVAKNDRMEVLVDLAARRGYSFTLDEVKAFVKAKAMASGRELSDTELDRAAAGVANHCGSCNHKPIDI